jgi:hypothetical protein
VHSLALASLVLLPPGSSIGRLVVAGPVPRWPSLKGGVPLLPVTDIRETRHAIPQQAIPMYCDYRRPCKSCPSGRMGKIAIKTFSGGTPELMSRRAVDKPKAVVSITMGLVEDQQKNAVDNNLVITRNYHFFLPFAGCEEIISAYRGAGKRTVPKPEKRCLYARFASLIEGLGEHQGVLNEKETDFCGRIAGRKRPGRRGECENSGLLRGSIAGRF